MPGKRHHVCTRIWPPKNSGTKLFEEVAAIREKQQEYDAHLTVMGTRNSYSKTDPDATFMRMKEDHMKNGQLKPAYNLQLAVQSEYIIGLGLFPNPTDTRTLIPFLTALESEYGRLADHIVADAGYDSEENMDWIEKKGSTVCIKPREYEYRKTSAFKKKSDTGAIWPMTQTAIPIPVPKEGSCIS